MMPFPLINDDKGNQVRIPFVFFSQKKQEKSAALR